MDARQLGVTVVAVAALGAAIGAGAATADDPSWQKALEARSIALNREYGLGHAQRRALGDPGHGWLEALRARSDALNRAYGLGEYGREGARSGAAPDWLAALQARSEALNRQYGLGEYGRAAAHGGRSIPRRTRASR